MVGSYAPTVSARRWFPAAFGLVAGIGLLSTLLPMWSITVHSNAFRRGRSGTMQNPDGLAADQGNIHIHVGFYDWVVSGRPVAAALPAVLALAVAVAMAAWLWPPSRTLWGVTASAAVCAAIVVGATAVRPTSRQEVTGQVAERMSPSQLATIQHPAPMDVGIGAGLVLAILSVAAVGALAAWQYFAVTGRPTP